MTDQEIKKEFSNFNRELENKMEDELENLIDQMRLATPVDTGNLRDSYQDPIKKGRFKWRIVNNADYATEILLIGQTPFNRGSAQLPDGITPVIINWQKNLRI